MNTTKNLLRKPVSPDMLNSFAPFRLLLYCLVISALVSCNGADPVAPDFAGKPPSVRRDTIRLTDLKKEQLPMYTGSVNIGNTVVGARFGAAGDYTDPLFGRTQAVHLLKPRLISKDVLDTIDINTTAFIDLRKLSITGDTTSAIEFDLVEITGEWRGSAWTKDSTITNRLGMVLNTFSWTKEDSLLVQLPAFWLQKYAALSYKDEDDISLFTMFGFALRPRNSGKIINLNLPLMTLRLFHPTKVEGTDRDTVLQRFVPLSTWATSYTSETFVPESGRVEIDNTFGNMLSFDIAATADSLNVTNVVNAELIFYEDTTAIKSTRPIGHIFSESAGMDVYLLSERDLLYDLTPVVPQREATRVTGTGIFRISLTTYIATQLRRNEEDDARFFLSYHTNSGSGTNVKGNDGTLRRTLLFDQSHPVFYPVLVLTSVIPND